MDFTIFLEIFTKTVSKHSFKIYILRFRLLIKNPLRKKIRYIVLRNIPIHGLLFISIP